MLVPASVYDPLMGARGIELACLIREPWRPIKNAFGDACRYASRLETLYLSGMQHVRQELRFRIATQLNQFGGERFRREPPYSGCRSKKLGPVGERQGG